MDIKLVCRLCCSEEEVKHSIFTPDESGLSLAEELSVLADIEITKEDHLSEFICVNCFKVNSFFKEFRKNCSEVNDYFKTCNTSALPGNVTIKEEQLDDYEDRSIDPSENQQEKTSSYSNSPYPVALVQSQRKDDLNQLRSKLLASKRAREESTAAVSTENQGAAPVRRAEKRKNNDTDGPMRRQKPRVDIPTEEDILNHIVKQEEVDISDSAAVASEAYHEESVNEPWSPPDSRPSLGSGNVGGLSSPDDDSSSSLSSCSSDESDDDGDMLMLLALLL